jgi:recombination protein RecA
MSELNSQFGKGSVMRLGDAPERAMETTPSGALTLDLALGGGYPKGRIIEIFGPESSGKTTLALHAMAEVQRAGGSAALIDAEHAFDASFAAALGLNTKDLVISQPESGEMALEVAAQLIKSGGVDMVCVDSVSALVPQAELEGEMGHAQIGSQARLMSTALKRLVGNASKCNCTIIFINQIRNKIGTYGNPEVTSGGNALKYYASVRIDLRRQDQIKTTSGESIGVKVRAKVVKNKCAPPYRQGEFDIIFGQGPGPRGINQLGCVLDVAERAEVVQRRGAYYFYAGAQLGQGKDKSLAKLRESPELAAEIEAKVREKMAQGDGDLVEVGDPEPDAEGADPKVLGGEGLEA